MFRCRWLYRRRDTHLGAEADVDADAVAKSGARKRKGKGKGEADADANATSVWREVERDHEVFLSKYTDDNPVRAIISKCRVVTKAEFDRLAGAGAVLKTPLPGDGSQRSKAKAKAKADSTRALFAHLETVFFCRSTYDVEEESFGPLPDSISEIDTGAGAEVGAVEGRVEAEAEVEPEPEPEPRGSRSTRRGMKRAIAPSINANANDGSGTGTGKGLRSSTRASTRAGCESESRVSKGSVNVTGKRRAKAKRGRASGSGSGSDSGSDSEYGAESASDSDLDFELSEHEFEETDDGDSDLDAEEEEEEEDDLDFDYIDSDEVAHVEPASKSRRSRSRSSGRLSRLSRPPTPAPMGMGGKKVKVKTKAETIDRKKTERRKGKLKETSYSLARARTPAHTPTPTPTPIPVPAAIDPTDVEAVYHHAHERLQPSAVPRKLPCRSDERRSIRRFVSGAIQRGGAGTALYISGMPGTGKTATVFGVLNELRADPKILPFTTIEINGMRLSDPRRLYTVLYQGITGRRETPARACDLLATRFQTPSPKRRTCVVVVDELDQLVTRNQTVLYNLFDWPGHPYAHLVVIGIANTMDLPERMLPRVHSRVGLTRISFVPYTREQLRQIVSSRLEGLDAFTPSAIELCSRRIAAVSGDARQALEICVRACELAQRQAEKEDAEDDGGDGDGDGSRDRDKDRDKDEHQKHFVKVTLEHIDKTVTEMRSATHVWFLSQASLHARIFVVALVIALRASGLSETTFGAVMQCHENICTGYGIPAPLTSDLSLLCNELCANRIMLSETSWNNDLFRRVRLCIDPEDVRYAVEGDAYLKTCFPVV